MPSSPSERTDWVTYGYRLCAVIRAQSTCMRRKVACVVFHGNRPIATGFNGVRSGEPHPKSLDDCKRHKDGVAPGQQPSKSCCIHAEQNAADLVRNTPWMGGDLWAVSWTEPCEACSAALTSVGVKTVYYHEPYPKAEASYRREGNTMFDAKSGLMLSHRPYNESVVFRDESGWLIDYR